MAMTREEILNIKDFEIIEVKVPEWGKDSSIFIKTMSGGDRDRFEIEFLNFQETKKFDNLRAKYVSFCICDEAGKCLFNTKDIEALGSKSAKAIERIYNACKKLNGFHDKDEQKLLEKN